MFMHQKQNKTAQLIWSVPHRPFIRSDHRSKRPRSESCWPEQMRSLAAETVARALNSAVRSSALALQRATQMSLILKLAETALKYCVQWYSQKAFQSTSRYHL